LGAERDSGLPEFHLHVCRLSAVCNTELHEENEPFFSLFLSDFRTFNIKKFYVFKVKPKTIYIHNIFNFECVLSYHAAT